MRFRAFCLPYAGGSARAFSHWEAQSQPVVDFRAVEIPGRGARFEENPHQSIESLVPVLIENLRAELHSPYVFFGHSMGALVAFELCRHIRQLGEPMPACLFVSGSRAPHRAPYELGRRWYDAPLPVFTEHLRFLNGCPSEVLNNSELMEVILPYLRADFQMVQSYRYEPGPPLALPLVAFGGIDDPDVAPGELEGWREHTTAEFESLLLPGDHFFIRDGAACLIEFISARLARMSS